MTIEQKQPGGLLEPLPIQERPWDSVSMDFITSLPKSERYGTFLVVVDKFTKVRLTEDAQIQAEALELELVTHDPPTVHENFLLKNLLPKMQLIAV
ncbi:Transposon Tf2-8 polyprotein [Linum perenne]